MAKTKVEEPIVEEEVVEEPIVEEVEDVVEEEKVKKEKGFDVSDKDGVYVRTYSKKLHGKDAEKLAKQFADKIGGTVSK